MLVKRKKERHNPQTIDKFVESVAEIHEAPQAKPAAKPEPPAEIKKEAAPAAAASAEPTSLFSGMKACNIGQSPEVQPRELLNV